MTLGILWANDGFVLRVICGVSVVWLTAAVGGLLLRRSSAALRHRIWALSIVAALGLPLAVLMLPEWRVGTINLLAPGESSPAIAQTSAVSSANATRAPEHASAASSHIASTSDVTSRTPRIAPRTNPLAEPLREGDGRGDDRLIDWQKCLAMIWLVPAIWLLLRQAVATLAVRSLLRRAKAIDDGPAATCLSQLVSRLAIRTRPRLLESRETAVPVCMGWLHPCILLPESARTWPAEQMEAVLTHELAHIARRDVLWQMLSRLACAMYWLHPLVWLAAWRMRVERELACDDWVLRGGQSSTRYARWLLDVATMLSTRRHSVESAGVAMAGRSNLESRISALLDPHRRRLPVSRRMAITLTFLAITLLVTIGSLSPLAPRPANAQAAPQQSILVATTKPTDAPRQKMVQIAGRVEDEQGKPVGGALVESWAGLNRYVTQTNSDGRFALQVQEREISYGKVQVNTQDGAKQTFMRLDAVTANQLGDLRLVVRPARQLAVTVKNAKGQPVAGAWVAATAWYQKVGETTTDAAGKALLRVPADAPLMYVVATKPNAGSDYVMFWRKDQPQTDPYRLAPDYSGSLSLVLNGVTTVKVRVLDERQRPLQGVDVHPWYFEKPKKGDDLNLSGLLEFQQRTDQKGEAVFEMPADNTARIVFWTRLEGHCAPNRSVWDPASGKTDLEAQMLRQIRVTGRVVDAEGRPAAGATVRVDGEGYQDDGFNNEQAVTAADGRFEIDVNPELYYMFVASKGQLVSKPSFQIIRREAPASLELKLEPAVRVYGQVTGGLDHTPVPGATVSLIQRDFYSYYKLPKDQQFPGGTTGRRGIGPSIAQHVMSDEQGLFEYYVAPGDCEYIVRVSSGASEQTQRFVLPSQTECTFIHDMGGLPENALAKEPRTIDPTKGLEINFYSAIAKPNASVLNGRVVLRDNPNTPVPEATLAGDHVGHENFSIEGTSDRQGNFTVRRGKSDLYLYATTSDKKLQGLLQVKPADDNVTLPIGPTASARGRLLDENGKPLADRQIDFGVRITHPGGSFGDRFGGQTKTAADGSFTIDGLVPGFEYTLNLVMELGDDGRPRSWRSVGKAKADRPEQVDLGDLKLSPPRRPNR